MQSQVTLSTAGQLLDRWEVCHVRRRGREMLFLGLEGTHKHQTVLETVMTTYGMTPA